MDRRRVKLLCNSIKGPTEANWPVSPSPGCTRLGRHCDNAIYVYARRPFTETSIPLGGNGRRIPFQGGGDRSSREYLEGEGWFEGNSSGRFRKNSTSIGHGWKETLEQWRDEIWWIFLIYIYQGILEAWLGFLMVKVFLDLCLNATLYVS